MKIYRLAQVKFDEEFFMWFGDSKVVDDKGNPMPVFHGTNQKIEEFDDDRLGENTKAVSSYGGFFFTEDLEEAQKYADLSARNQIPESKEHEMKEFNFMRQIEEAESNRDWDLAERLTIEMEDFSLGAIEAEPSGQKIYSVYLSIKNPLVVSNVGIKNTGEVSVIIGKAKVEGYDGVYLEDIQDGFVRQTNQWVAFSSQQIKVINENI